MGVVVFPEHDDAVETSEAPRQARKPVEEGRIQPARVGNHEIPAGDADDVDEFEEGLEGAVLMLTDHVDVANLIAADTMLAEADAPVHPVRLIGAVQGTEDHGVALAASELAAQIACDGDVSGPLFPMDALVPLTLRLIDAGHDDSRVGAAC